MMGFGRDGERSVSSISQGDQWPMLEEGSNGNRCRYECYMWELNGRQVFSAGHFKLRQEVNQIEWWVNSKLFKANSLSIKPHSLNQSIYTFFCKESMIRFVLVFGKLCMGERNSRKFIFSLACFISLVRHFWKRQHQSPVGVKASRGSSTISSVMI